MGHQGTQSAVGEDGASASLSRCRSVGPGRVRDCVSVHAAEARPAQWLTGVEYLSVDPAAGAGAYHTGRFTKVPRLAKLLRVPTPADRGPGQPWRPGTPPPAPIDPDVPTADIRIGYARCSTLGQELDSQLDALTEHGIPREKIFSEKISTRVRVRPLGKHGGRPPVITHDVLHTVLRRRAGGESVEQIQPDLVIPTGKRKGQSPSVASIYRALTEHEKRQAYPEAVAQASADFAALQNAEVPRPRLDAETSSRP